MNMLRVEPNLECDDGEIFGVAEIKAIGLTADWAYFHTDNKVALGDFTIDGRTTIMSPDDPLYQEVLNACIDAVQVHLGRAEIAAEIAHDEAVDRAIDEMREAELKE